MASQLPTNDPVEPALRATLEQETQVSACPVMRRVYVVAGSVAVVLGVVGAFLPVMPTTVFLLIAAACYARGSSRFYVWLMTNRWFGAYVRTWRHSRGVPRRVKGYILATMTIALGTSIVLVPLWPVRFVLLATGAGVGFYIARLPAPGGVASDS